VLAGPLAEDYHFAVLAVPIVLLLSTTTSIWPWMGLVGALLLVPLRLTAFRFQDGWLSLVAYPRLYAGWLLWSVHACCSRLRAEEGSRVRQASEP
jgi:hypothetical protein